jgi:predicted phage terminase large subunit-like protein
MSNQQPPRAPTTHINTSERANARGATSLRSSSPTAASVQKKAKSSKVAGDANDLRVQALHSIPAFAELIKFQGGWENFSTCHEELATFLCKPQVDVEAQQKLKYLGNEYEAALRRLVLMPRGHLKSTIGTTLYTLWRLYRNPELRIFVGSNKQTLSFSFIRELRQWLENEELQITVWNNRPHIEGNLIPEINKRSRERNRNASAGDDTDAADRKLIWNNTALQVLREGTFKEPSVFAGSVGASVTGQHYDLVILDDLIDFKNTESDVKKERVEEWIQDIESILNPVQLVAIPGVGLDTVGGEMVISGTRYAVDDYYGFLLERLEELQYVAHIRNIYKNGVDESEGFLWHERYNTYTVAALKARTSPRRFSSQYLNTVYEKDIALLDLSACTVIADDHVSTLGNAVAITIDNRTEYVTPIICIDPAFSTGKSGDDCAIVVGCKLSDGRVVVIDGACDRMEAADVVKTTLEFAAKYKTMRVFHEANGVGLLVPELFKSQQTQINGKLLVVNSHYEQRPKEAKIQGVLELPFALGSFVFTQKLWSNERIMKQMKNYPAVRHDDWLDALVTLFEKATPNRGAKVKAAQGEIKWGLNVERMLANAEQPKPTLLGGFNAYFR